jgi:membrane protease YdiL (CAAX protease family)
VGEEFGWRAFMLPRLQLRFRAMRAALIVGIAWGIWHLPADFIGLRSYGWLFIPYFILAGPLLLTAHAIIMTWIYNSTRNMAFIVLYHFTITSSAILLPTLSLNPVENIINVAISVVVLWILALIIIIANGPTRLARSVPSSE